MSISEDDVGSALEYLAEDPHPIAVARFKLTLAENGSKETYAKLFLQSNQTTNDAKKASVECHPDYVKRKEDEAKFVMEYERQRSRVKAAEMLIEVWRTENANARAAERVR